MVEMGLSVMAKVSKRTYGMHYLNEGPHKASRSIGVFVYM